MHRRILSLALVGFLGIIIINWSCTKIDTTTLGSDLIPVVDNINTFADTFYINATQHTFADTDSVLVPATADQVLGNIVNDPLFGQTEAKLFVQLKPSYFPYALPKKDSIFSGSLDSVVLCLSYKSFYGDSSIPQTLQVNEITDAMFRDSLNTTWPTTYQPVSIGSQVAPLKQVFIPSLANYMYYNNKRDSVNNQIRIKLDSATFAARLFESDSASSGTGNHAFRNDSIFRQNFIGFAIKSVAGTGNALMYINYADTNTKLEIHYRVKNGSKIDSIYTSFNVAVNPRPGYGVEASLTANYIRRNRAGASIENPAPGELYLQTQPGTYANLSIPKLTGYSNRIVHRAEIIIEQIPDPLSDKFVSPNFMYLDLKDSANTIPVKYKPLYLDLRPTTLYYPDNNPGPFYPEGGPDFSYFGGFVRKKPGPFGGEINFYNINVTRYIQHMVRDQSRNYDMRLFPAFRFRYPQYSGSYIEYNNSAAYGRIRVGTGENPNYRMRIRIIYSNLK